MQTAGKKDKVAVTKKLGDNLMHWVRREATPKIIRVGKDLTIPMATAIAVGLVKAYFHLP